MRKTFALACLLFPLAASADFNAKAFVEGELEAHAQEQREKPAEYRVTGACTFPGGNQSREVGHKHDFKSRTFGPSNEGNDPLTLKVVEWVAGPSYGLTDFILEGYKVPGIEVGWKVSNYTTADDAVHVIDITAAPTLHDVEMFEEKLILMVDSRTRPIQAYLMRTPIFPLDKDTTMNKWVGFATHSGTCEGAE